MCVCAYTVRAIPLMCMKDGPPRATAIRRDATHTLIDVAPRRHPQNAFWLSQFASSYNKAPASRLLGCCSEICGVCGYSHIYNIFTIYIV